MIMVFNIMAKCVVHFSKGNYKAGNNVAAFGFLKDEELKRNWMFKLNNLG